MNTEATHGTAQELIAKISCLLDDIEYEFGLEDYTSAQTAISELIDRAQNLQQLLNLISFRSEILPTDAATNKEMIGLINLETACRDIAGDMLHIQTAVDNNIEKNAMQFKDDIKLSHEFKISFYSKERKLLARKDASLISYENGGVYLQLHDCQVLSDAKRFIF